MNERIEELLKQAFAECKTVEDGTMIRTTEAFARFAELIVRECMSQIALIGISNSENEDISWACHKAVENIKDHFGINSNQCNRKNCDKGTDGYCARCHAESYPFM